MPYPFLFDGFKSCGGLSLLAALARLFMLISIMRFGPASFLLVFSPLLSSCCVSQRQMEWAGRIYYVGVSRLRAFVVKSRNVFVSCFFLPCITISLDMYGNIIFHLIVDKKIDENPKLKGV